MSKISKISNISKNSPIAQKDNKKKQEDILLMLKNEQNKSLKLESVINRYRNIIRDQKNSNRSSIPGNEEIEVEKNSLNKSVRSKSQVAKISSFKSITTFVEYNKFLKSLSLMKLPDTFQLILNNLRQVIYHTKISLILFQDFYTNDIQARSIYLRIGKKILQVLYPLDIKYSDLNYL